MSRGHLYEDCSLYVNSFRNCILIVCMGLAFRASIKEVKTAGMTIKTFPRNLKIDMEIKMSSE